MHVAPTAPSPPPAAAAAAAPPPLAAAPRASFHSVANVRYPECPGVSHAARALATCAPRDARASRARGGGTHAQRRVLPRLALPTAAAAIVPRALAIALAAAARVRIAAVGAIDIGGHAIAPRRGGQRRRRARVVSDLVMPQQHLHGLDACAGGT